MNGPFLDREKEIVIADSGILPHWNQHGKIQFVTFRLADSLPREKAVKLNEIKDRFVANHPRPWDDAVRFEYSNLLSPYIMKLLDNGYGSCLLKYADVRQIVSDALHYNDGKKYRLIAFVIMPNHVHLLIQMIGENCVEPVIHSIKSYSSSAINKMKCRKGSVWMREYFDRIIRSEDHLKSTLHYILSNPRFLKDGDFEVYVNEWVINREE